MSRDCVFAVHPGTGINEQKPSLEDRKHQSSEEDVYELNSRLPNDIAGLKMAQSIHILLYSAIEISLEIQMVPILSMDGSNVTVFQTIRTCKTKREDILRFTEQYAQFLGCRLFLYSEELARAHR
jgi:hypothetical protein